MKKILSLILCAVMLCSLVALTGCTPANASLKFGTAVYVDAPSSTDASADKAGEGSVDVTAAAVTVDADGKIVACRIDTMQNKVGYTTEGKAEAAKEFKTKRELGNDYGMSAIGKKEWFEQIDALEKVVVGKTLDEVKALVVEGKGNDEVINAGCTIFISSYIGAIEKAYNNAAESDVTAEDTLKIGMHTDYSSKDATADANGECTVDVYAYVAAVGADGKVVAGNSDCAQVKFTFDTAGKAGEVAKEVKTKKELGNDYGMSATGKAEWFEQAAAFDSQCVGKTGTEIAALMGNDGKGVEAVQTAGCTIYVSGLVKAASKI